MRDEARDDVSRANKMSTSNGGGEPTQHRASAVPKFDVRGQSAETGERRVDTMEAAPMSELSHMRRSLVVPNWRTLRPPIGARVKAGIGATLGSISDGCVLKIFARG